jgi:hypothetical protein
LYGYCCCERRLAPVCYSIHQSWCSPDPLPLLLLLLLLSLQHSHPTLQALQATSKRRKERNVKLIGSYIKLQEENQVGCCVVAYMPGILGSQDTLCSNTSLSACPAVMARTSQDASIVCHCTIIMWLPSCFTVVAVMLSRGHCRCSSVLIGMAVASWSSCLSMCHLRPTCVAHPLSCCRPRLSPPPNVQALQQAVAHYESSAIQEADCAVGAWHARVG